MPTQVVAFRPGQEDSTHLLAESEREASFIQLSKSKQKKKGWKGLFKKNKEEDKAAGYEPPPMPVTVVAGSKKKTTPPRHTRKTSDAISTISELTYPVGTSTPGPPKTPVTVRSTPSTSGGSTGSHRGLQKRRSTGTMNSPDSRSNPSPALTEEEVVDDVFQATMSYLDGICSEPASKNLGPAMEKAATEKRSSKTKRNSDVRRGPVWGLMPTMEDDDEMEEDDETYDDTTTYEDRTQTSSTADLSSRVPGGRKSMASSRWTEPSSSVASATRMPAHENFEVILDASLLQQNQPQSRAAAGRRKDRSASPKRRNWFSASNVPKERSKSVEPYAPFNREEEKKEDDMDMRATFVPLARKISKPDVKPEVERDAVEMKPNKKETPVLVKPKPSLAKRLSAVMAKPQHHASDEKQKTAEGDLLPVTRQVSTPRVAPEADLDGVEMKPRAPTPPQPKSKANKGSFLGKRFSAAKNAKKTEEKTGKQEAVPERKTETKSAPPFVVASKPAQEKAPKAHASAPSKSFDETDKKSSAKAKDVPKERSVGRNKSWGGFGLFKKNGKKDANSDSKGKTKDKEGPIVVKKPPRPLWKAVEDPTTKRTYYYHRNTRETTWTKPQELIDYEKKVEELIAAAKAERAAQRQRGVSVVQQKPKPVEPAPAATSKNMETPARTTVVVNNKKKAPQTPESAYTEESSFKPPSVVEAAVPGENLAPPAPVEKQEPKQVAVKSDDADADWEKKKEINRLLLAVPEADRRVAERTLDDHRKDLDYQLQYLRDLVESKPFDEPEEDVPMDEPRYSTSKTPPRVGTKLSRRIITGTSATTRSSQKTETTQKIKNTHRGPKQPIMTISEDRSEAGTSITTDHGDGPLRKGARPPTTNPASDARVPSKVPAVQRHRELKVEDLSDSRLAAETFSSSGRVIQGASTDQPEDENYSAEGASYYGDNDEAESYGDSVSALSDTDNDYGSRRSNFENARRRALEDAIDRQDWDLAAALSDGMKRSNSNVAQQHQESQSKWKQSEIDKFIASNNWEAVSSYIAQMRDRAQTDTDEDNLIMSPSAAAGHSDLDPSSVVKAPSRAVQDPLTEPASRLEKRIGSRSQLQHHEIVAESGSWSTEDSYDSYDSEYS